MTFDKEQAYEIYEEEQGIAKAARDYCKQIGIEYEERYRHQLSRYISTLDDVVGESAKTSSDPPVAGYTALRPDGSLMSPEEVCAKHNLPFENLKECSLVAHTSKTIYNMKFSFDAAEQDFTQFKEDLLQSIRAIPTKTVKPHKPEEGVSYLLVIDPADIHLGKNAQESSTGNVYNSDIAAQRVLEGVQGILDKCSGFKIDQILFVAGNDLLHCDDSNSRTTKGTYVDSEGTWDGNFIKAKELYIRVLDMLSEVANIHYTFNPSNHDYKMGYLLSQVVEAYFHENERIVFDIDLKHRKYFRYHNNLIGTTHGDCAKLNDLGSLMAEESSDWSECKNRYIYTHHVHHKTSKDFIGVTVESVRSPSGSDVWHTKNGYVGVPKAVEGFLHDKNQGQVCRITHNF